MAKRKRRRARARKATNPKKRVHRRRKERQTAAAAAAPRRRRRSAPRRSHTGVRRSHRRRAAHAPVRAHARRRRHHRRNPGLPPWAMAGVAAGLALVSFVAVSAGSYALTQKSDPTLKNLERNRYLAAGLAGVGGAILAMKKSPLMGAAVAAGALVSALGIKATLAVQKSLASSASSSDVPAGTSGLGAYHQIAGYEPIGAVYGNMAGMGAVYGNMAGMGAMAPAPPWIGSNPF